jgi:hypothetical protein
MRHIFLFVFLIIGLNVGAFSQAKKLTVRTGAGYYLDTFGLAGGQIFWLEGGVKGYKTIALRQMVDLTFSRPFKLTGQHYLEPGVGFKLKREFHLYPDFQYIYSSGTYNLSTSYSDIFYDIGFTICLDYQYQFPSGFFFGLRTDTNVIWALGFEGLTISPIFGFRF